MKMVILDVTAGNRVMWHRNRNPYGVIFIDKEHGLFYPPDIVADNRVLPIRLNLKIESIIFDPPWGINLPPWFLNMQPTKTKKTWGNTNTYYGDFNSKRDLLCYIYQAQKEFMKYTNRLCFKWGERNIPLWKILPIFRDWNIIRKKNHNALYHRSSKIGGSVSKNQTWWLTFIR